MLSALNPVGKGGKIGHTSGDVPRTRVDSLWLLQSVESSNKSVKRLKYLEIPDSFSSLSVEVLGKKSSTVVQLEYSSVSPRHLSR